MTHPRSKWTRHAASALMLAAALGLCSCEKAPTESGAQPAPEIVTTTAGDEMVRIPAGRFRMGAEGGEADRQPVHEVYVDAFLIDRTEVTQEQMARLRNANGSKFKGPRRPVESITWADAVDYCNERSEAEGLTPCYRNKPAGDGIECDFDADGYRLPTEAEWEYACRAGSPGRYAFGDDPTRLGDHAWFAANARNQTRPARQKKPNAWGLYDMHGNVAEWCNDYYAKDYYPTSPSRNPRGPAGGKQQNPDAEEQRVLRGGSWKSSAAACGAAQRAADTEGYADACYPSETKGFRCVRRIPAKTAPQSPPASPRRTSGVLSSRQQHAVQAPPLNGTLRNCDPLDARQQHAAGPPPLNRTPKVHPHPHPLHAPPTPTHCVAWVNTPAPTPTPAPEPPATRPATRPAAKTGFVYDAVYLKHDTGRSHPERPQRLTAIRDRLAKTGLLRELVAIRSRPAAERGLATVHDPAYIARVRKACLAGPTYLDSRDTPVSKDSYPAALHAAGGVLAAVDTVMAGQVRNAFCAVRPPGHHALKDRAMGFCVFNNVAIAARYIQARHKLARVLIVDWDVHHGNGTQAIFYEDPTVFYFGVHRSPFYPGTGAADERGKGAGIGATLNVPLKSGRGDREFVAALTDKLVPAMRTFRPDFVLISAGFDAHEKDPLGGMKMTAAGYAELTRIVRGIADRHARGRVVSVLEGGYSLEGLAASCEAHLRALMK